LTKVIGAAFVLLVAAFAAIPAQARPPCAEAQWCAAHNNAPGRCWCWRRGAYRDYDRDDYRYRRYRDYDRDYDYRRYREDRY
jgi:hypothetical protein